MIMDGKRHKITLCIKNDFSMNHAEMLLKYQTYLLYNVSIKLESSDAFKAINYFLKTVEGAISYQFFWTVEAYAGKSWIDLYNEFVKLYLEKGFKYEKLNVKVIRALDFVKL